MKNINLTILLTLLTGVMYQEIETKALCVKGYEWRNGRCRKNKDKPAQPQLTPTPPILGNNPLTYAPQTFEPSKKYAGDGLVGNYFASSHLATIHDPAGKNPVSYTFEQVEERGIQAPESLELIGTYLATPKCGAGKFCAMAMRVVNLYGKLKIDTSSTEQREPVLKTPIQGIAVGEPAQGNQFDTPKVAKKNVQNNIYTFTPDANLFDTQNFSGLYDAANKTATIMNNSEEKIATFINVQELRISRYNSNTAAPANLTYIGFMIPMISCSGCPTKIELYGTINDEQEQVIVTN